MMPITAEMYELLVLLFGDQLAPIEGDLRDE